MTKHRFYVYPDPSDQRRRDPQNKYGCKPIEDVCVEHDEPLLCEHGCESSVLHYCEVRQRFGGRRDLEEHGDDGDR